MSCGAHARCRVAGVPPNRLFSGIAAVAQARSVDACLFYLRLDGYKYLVEQVNNSSHDLICMYGSQSFIKLQFYHLLIFYLIRFSLIFIFV